MKLNNKNLVKAMVFVLITIFLYFSSLINYLLFHTFSELFSITIGFSIALITWNSSNRLDNGFLSFIGVSSFFVSFIDLVHTLTYKGMNIIPDIDSNLPTQLWIIARYFQSITILIAFYFMDRKLNIKKQFLSMVPIGFFLILLLVLDIFPDCYIEGIGLTPFKKISEYVISSFLIISIILLMKKNQKFEKGVSNLLIHSFISMVIAELAFTYYIDVYGLSNLVGHFLKILAYYLLYKVIIEKGINQPHLVLFRNLQLRETELEAFIETNPDGILVIKKNGEIALINESAKFYFPKLTKTEGNKYSNLWEIDTNNPIIEFIKIIVSELKEDTIEIEFQTNKIWVQIESKIIKLKNENEPYGLMISIHDISPYKEFNNIRKRFISTVSHELRTPITGINLSINNLVDYSDKISETQKKEMFDMIIKNSEVLLKLTDDLMVLSTMDEEILELKWERFSLNKLINDVLLKMDSKKELKHITINLNLNKEIEIIADRFRLDQVFRVLLDNAIKYSKDHTSIEINITDNYIGEYNKDNRAYILIEFVDNGIGIPEKDLTNVFERFFRSDTVETIQGTGLGLSIAKEILQLHHGDIFVKSLEGKGSTFSVLLPMLENIQNT